MNRTIKFRAWNMGLMYYSDFVVKANGQVLWWELEKGYKILSDCPIMQFTGLLDKNGKEIYEGDIVYNESDKFFNYDIRWDEKDAGWSLGENGTPIKKYALNEFWEVIGNVFENPKLLK
jgi:hypothetical protein